MANGLLGKGMAVANTPVKIYTATAGILFATVSIYCFNNGAVNSDVQIYIGTSDTPSAGDMIDKATLVPGGQLANECRIVSAGEKVIVKATTADVVIRVEGLEEVAV